MERALRVGIAGAGFIGTVHARAARRAGATVAGVVASTPQRAHEAARHLGGGARAFADAQELIADERIDVIHLCTPNHLHAPLAAQALAAGKHVVCEKPLASGLDEALDLAAAAERAPRQLAAVPFVYRYYPTVREARHRIATGRTGALALIHGTYLQDWLLTAEDDNWRVDPALGGASRAFADIGSHWCDLAEFVSGHRIARLSARTLAAHPHRPTEDAATVQFETDAGALGSLVVSQVSAGRKNRLWLELDGAQAALAFDQEDPEVLWCGGRDQTTLVRRDPATLSPAAARLSLLPAGHPQGYQDCFDLFVADAYAAIADAAAPPDGLPTFADGLRAARLTAAVLDSAREQAWVEVPR
jgi:predicted dehydrogenase